MFCGCCLHKDAHDPESFAQELMSKVHIVTCDGGSEVQKCARLLQRSPLFPHLRLVHRDNCHKIRIGLFEPLKRQAVFKDVWSDLLQGRNAIIPAIQHSAQWKARLVACQRNLQGMRQDTSSTGNSSQLLRDEASRDREANTFPHIDTVLRHFSLAQQRYDSLTGPLRKISAVFVAVGSMLAQFAEDKRADRRKRQMAREFLQNHMNGVSMITTALASDYTAVCAEFLRRFDVASHDLSAPDGVIEVASVIAIVTAKTLIARLVLMFGGSDCPTPSTRAPSGKRPSGWGSVRSVCLRMCAYSYCKLLVSVSVFVLCVLAFIVSP